MAEKLRYEGFSLGQIIRCQDFEPIAGRENCFIEGKIVAVNRDGEWGAPYAHYVIEPTRQVWRGEEMVDPCHGVNNKVRVPMEIAGLEWDMRVEEVK